jgi:hypothetical protein
MGVLMNHWMIVAALCGQTLALLASLVNLITALRNPAKPMEQRPIGRERRRTRP